MSLIVPACAVVTAPDDGRVHRVADPDHPVRAGDVVAVLDGPRGRTELTSPVKGRVGGALAEPSQAVTAGEGVLWLSRP